MNNTNLILNEDELRLIYDLLSGGIRNLETEMEQKKDKLNKDTTTVLNIALLEKKKLLIYIDAKLKEVKND